MQIPIVRLDGDDQQMRAAVAQLHELSRDRAGASSLQSPEAGRIVHEPQAVATDMETLPQDKQ